MIIKGTLISKMSNINSDFIIDFESTDDNFSKGTLKVKTINFYLILKFKSFALFSTSST